MIAYLRVVLKGSLPNVGERLEWANVPWQMHAACLPRTEEVCGLARKKDR
jgi:hypothetical protein